MNKAERERGKRQGQRKRHRDSYEDRPKERKQKKQNGMFLSVCKVSIKIKFSVSKIQLQKLCKQN